MPFFPVATVHLLLTLAAATEGMPPAPQHTLLVLPLTARSGLPASEVALLTDYLASEARRIPNFRALSMADVETMVSVETKAQLAGCEATSCLAEIGGALQAEEVLTGTLGRLGERELVLTLNRTSPRTVTVLAGESERITGGGHDAALDGVSRLLKRLYPAYEPPAPRVKPMSRALLMGLITGVGAAVQYAAFASMFTSVLFWPCPLLALGMVGVSAGACCTAPFYASALQSWMMDFVGRRQAGFRHAAWVGGGLLALVGVLTVGMMGALTLMGWLVGLIGPDQVGAKNPSAVNALRLVVPLANNLPLNFALMGTFAGLLVGVLALVTLVPFGQAVTILLMSRARSADVEAQPPRLYAIYEDVPPWMAWIPCRLLGGAPPAQPMVPHPELDVTPEKAATPAAE
jgi:hypothetical protein